MTKPLRRLTFVSANIRVLSGSPDPMADWDDDGVGCAAWADGPGSWSWRSSSR